MFITYLLLLTIYTEVSAGPIPNGVCSNGYCGNVSYKVILQTYQGLFFTEEELSEKLQTLSSIRNENLEKAGLNITDVKSLPGDGDTCCPTEVRHYRYETLENTQKEVRNILQMPDADPPLYQHIHSGSCISNFDGLCIGRCVMERIELQLLAVVTEYLIIFDSFYVPGYCSCKNIQSSTVDGATNSKPIRSDG